MEEMYGHDYFARTCEAWVNGISQFAEKSGGKLSSVLTWKGCINRGFLGLKKKQRHLSTVF